MNHESTEKIVYRTKQPKRPKRSWRDYSDARWHGYARAPRAESCRPEASTVIRAVIYHDAEAVSIIDAWRGCLGWQHLVVHQ